MKVSEFIELLKQLPQDHEVIMSKDSEGNSFSPFADFGIEMYEPECTWSGYLVDPESSHRTSVYKKNAVVLWPTN